MVSMAAPVWYDFIEETEDLEEDDWDFRPSRGGQRPRRDHGRGKQQQQHVHVGRWIRADWIEGPEAHMLKVDLPGVSRDNVHVSVEEQQTLVISGIKHKDKLDRKKGEKARYYERVGGEFVRHFSLPKDTVKIDDIIAHMEDGVLTVVIPKIKEVEAKRDVRTINVQHGGGASVPSDATHPEDPSTAHTVPLASTAAAKKMKKTFLKTCVGYIP